MSRTAEILLALLAVGMIASAAWMIYRPLGPLVAGCILLVELLTSRGSAGGGN